MKCCKCSYTLADGMKFCHECGAKQENTCSCGVILEVNMKFCHSCGTPVGGTATPSASALQSPQPQNVRSSTPLSSSLAPHPYDPRIFYTGYRTGLGSFEQNTNTLTGNQRTHYFMTKPCYGKGSSFYPIYQRHLGEMEATPLDLKVDSCYYWDEKLWCMKQLEWGENSEYLYSDKHCFTYDLKTKEKTTIFHPDYPKSLGLSPQKYACEVNGNSKGLLLYFYTEDENTPHKIYTLPFGETIPIKTTLPTSGMEGSYTVLISWGDVFLVRAMRMRGLKDGLYLVDVQGNVSPFLENPVFRNLLPFLYDCYCSKEFTWLGKNQEELPDFPTPEDFAKRRTESAREKAYQEAMEEILDLCFKFVTFVDFENEFIYMGIAGGANTIEFKIPFHLAQSDIDCFCPEDYISFQRVRKLGQARLPLMKADDRGDFTRAIEGTNGTFLQENGTIVDGIIAPDRTFNGEVLSAWGRAHQLLGSVMYQGTYYYFPELAGGERVLGDQIYVDDNVYTIPTDLDREVIPYQERTKRTIKFLDES